MATWIARDASGWHVLPDGGLSAHRLENESIGRPCHWWAAYEVNREEFPNRHVLAKAGDFMVGIYQDGGEQGFIKVNESIGWVVDTEGAIPDNIYQALLAIAKGEPLEDDDGPAD